MLSQLWKKYYEISIKTSLSYCWTTWSSSARTWVLTLAVFIYYNIQLSIHFFHYSFRSDHTLITTRIRNVHLWTAFCFWLTGVSFCYISRTKLEAVSTFLHLEKLENKTAHAIACGFKNVLQIYGIELSDVVAICNCYNNVFLVPFLHIF